MRPTSITTSRFYLGGMFSSPNVSRGSIETLDTNGPSPDSFLQHISGEHELFLRVQPSAIRPRPRVNSPSCFGDTQSLTPPHLPRPVSMPFYSPCWSIIEGTKTSLLRRLEGSFTIALLDGEAGRLLLFRNIVGTGFTYYTQTPEGLFFSRNLANLVRHLDTSLSPNEAVLPAYFLYRFVPGRETLFAGVYRLMPGEQVSYEPGRLRRKQLRTIGQYSESQRIGRDAVDHVDRTMARVIADCAAVHPRAVNLLSGGVDSSLIQVFWNRAWPQEQGRPETFTVSLDHPRSRPDAEYALSAAKAPGHPTHACSCRRLLMRTICGRPSRARESPPNHVQAIYFRYLARVLAARGIEAALCGEGADSLFGVGLTSTLQMALLLRKGVPAGFLRRVGSRLASGTGHPSFAACLDLAGRIEDLDNIEHPINQVAVFTDLPAVTACFARTWSGRRPEVQAAIAGSVPDL